MMFECIDKIYPSVSIDTLTGSIVSFNDEYGGLPLKSCTSLISGYQEGSGVPSPSNVRNLVSFNSATLTENGNIHLFTFGQSIYQGYIDWKRGVVTATIGVRVFDGSSDETWRTYSGQRYTVPVSDFTSPSNSQLANIICDKLETITKAQQGSRTFVISGSDADSHDFMVNVGANSYNDMIDWLNANPITVAYELAIPIEIPLGGINLLTQEGQNNFFCDTGDTTIEYINIT